VAVLILFSIGNTKSRSTGVGDLLKSRSKKKEKTSSENFEGPIYSETSLSTYVRTLLLRQGTTRLREAGKNGLHLSARGKT